MRPTLAPFTRTSLGALSLLALAGCYRHDHDYVRGPVSSYYVNAIAVADLDGNGRRDILGLVSLATDGTPEPSYVTTRLQDSTGGFAMPARFGVGRGPANLVVADLNGDGRPDLIVPNADDRTVSVRLADPAKPGFFLPALVLSTPGRTPLDVAVGDLNGDGKLDIAVAASGANNVLVFTQTATGTFNAPITYAVGGDPQALTIADLDSNGRVDLAVATTANTVSVLLQTGAGTFAPAVDYVTGVQPVAIQSVDLNGDGKLDLLTANFGAATTPGTQGLSVLLQGAAGTYAAPQNYITAYRPCGLAVGDLNGDGRPDVAVACQGLPGDPGAVSVLLHSPTTPGALLAAVDYRGVSGPMGVAIADMDGDGHPDLVLADGDIVVRLNSGTGTFGAPNFFYN